MFIASKSSLVTMKLDLHASLFILPDASIAHVF